jgi:hypothetical protein
LAGGAFGSAAGTARSTVAAATIADLRLNNITNSDSPTTRTPQRHCPTRITPDYGFRRVNGGFCLMSEGLP